MDKVGASIRTRLRPKMHPTIIIQVLRLDNIINYLELLLKLKDSHAFIIFDLGPNALDNLTGEHRKELHPFIHIFYPFIQLVQLGNTSSLHTTLVNKTNIGLQVEHLTELLLIEKLAELGHDGLILLEFAIDDLVHQLLVLFLQARLDLLEVADQLQLSLLELTLRVFRFLRYLVPLFHADEVHLNFPPHDIQLALTGLEAQVLIELLHNLLNLGDLLKKNIDIVGMLLNLGQINIIKLIDVLDRAELINPRN